MSKAPSRRSPSKKTPRRPNGSKTPRSSLSLGLLTAGGTIGLFLMAALIALWAVYWGPGPKASDKAEFTVVTLPSGAGVSAIAANLKQAGVIRSTDLFRAAVGISGADRKIRAGEYQVPSGTSLSGVVKLLVEGKSLRHFVTIPEGWSSAQAVEILMRHPILTGEVAAIPDEGSLWPDTYEVTRGEDRSAVVNRMQRAAATKLEKLWAERSPSTYVKTPEEAVILASIVEKETGADGEREQVAAVFTNRLRMGMRLESDPTIIYGITKGRPLGRGIRASEIRAPSAWNTYTISGLPPTPIANPGEEALKAVLSPPRSEYLFFVADGTGGHVFARNYQEHLINVARWREIERRRAAIARGESIEDLPGAAIDGETGPRILLPEQIPSGAQVIRVPQDATQ